MIEITNLKGFDDSIPVNGGYTKIIGSMPQGGKGHADKGPIPDDTFADFCMIFPVEVIVNEKGHCESIWII